MLTMEQAITSVIKKKSEYVLKHKLTENRKQQLLRLQEVMTAMPDAKQKDWAEELEWSVQRVNRRKREIEEYVKQGLVIADLEV